MATGVQGRHHLGAGGFALYEFMVNLIPGLVFLVLLVALAPWIVPFSYLTQFGGLTNSLLVLVSSFVIGRILQGISGIESARKKAMRLFKRYGKWLDETRAEPYYMSFEDRMRHVVNTETDDNLEYELCRQIIEYLCVCTELEFEVFTSSDQDTEDEEQVSTSEPGKKDNFECVKHLSDSLVYKEGLAWKYGILMTFFRNIWIVLLSFSVLFLLKSVGLLVVSVLRNDPLFILEIIPDLLITNRPPIEILVTENPPVELLAAAPITQIMYGLVYSGLLFIAAIVAIQQRFTFKRRFNRASINELYVAIRELANDEIRLAGEAESLHGTHSSERPNVQAKPGPQTEQTARAGEP